MIAHNFSLGNLGINVPFRLNSPISWGIGLVVVILSFRIYYALERFLSGRKSSMILAAQVPTSTISLPAIGDLVPTLQMPVSGMLLSAHFPEPVTTVTAPDSTVRTPLSLADLAGGPGFADAKLSSPQVSKPVTAIAAVADEDEDADTMPAGNYDPTLDLARYQFPTLELLNDYGVAKAQVTKEELEANKDRIVETLGHYGIASPASRPPSAPRLRSMRLYPRRAFEFLKSRHWKMTLR